MMQDISIEEIVRLDSERTRGVVEITGNRYSKLTVLARNGVNKQGKPLWLCRCDCGITRIVDPRMLLRGRTKSCGCMQKEIVGKCSSEWKEFDQSIKFIPEYSIWLGMKGRCCNAKQPRYKDYGGRGIMICDRWINDFSAFFADMGKRPNASYSIDRIDVNGNYSPENCRWATPEQQALNKRATIRVEYQGEFIPLAEAASRSGVNYKSALYRYNQGVNWQIPIKQPLPKPPAREGGA